MRISLQHTTDQEQDWVDIDHADWPAYVTQFKRPLPAGGELLDQPGYLNCLSVMGLYGDGDHYAIEPYGADGVKMTLWYDHAADLAAPGYDSIGPGPRAIVWTFEPMRQIAAKGGMWQPKLTRRIYGGQEYLTNVMAKEIINGKAPKTCSLDETAYTLWDSFVPPDDAVTLHGIWMPKSLHDAHQVIRSPQSWREWTDGVPSEICRDGKLVSQREIGQWVKPDGTITWFLLDDGVTTGVHTGGVANEDGMDQTNPASAVGQVSGNLASGADELSFQFSSPSGEPGTATWPTGDYRCQFDVSATGGNLTYGLLTLGGSAGHFARVDSGLTTDGTTHAQTEGAFSGVANHLATTGSVSWGSPGSTDRWECLIASIRSVGLHGNQAFTVDLDQADSFTDGPWAAPAGPSGPLPGSLALMGVGR